MAKEFKQRKIKDNNSKYIKLAIIIIAIIIIVSLIITIIKVNTNKNNNSSNSSNTTQSNSSKNNTTIEENNQNTVQKNNKNTEINQTDIEPIINVKNEPKEFEEIDAMINRIQREMTTKNVEDTIGLPEKIEVIQEETTGYKVLRYYYNQEKTQIDFVDLRNNNTYVVHRIRTTTSDAVITRNIKIGDDSEMIISAFKSESILYKDAEQIIVGFPNENPMYATSEKAKIYFKIDNQNITEILVSIGNEN